MIAESKTRDEFEQYRCIERVLDLLSVDLAKRIRCLAEHWERPLSHTVAVLLRRGLRDAEMQCVCRDCGCCEQDPCVDDESACYWVADDFCSACLAKVTSGLHEITAAKEA